MPSQLNQNQVLNYLADLPSLLDQARPYLDLKNRQGKEADFNLIDQFLRICALGLILMGLEEDLPFEEVFGRLEWLFEQEKLIAGRSVPVNLEELEAELQEKEEKAAKEARQHKKLVQEAEKLTADLKKRAELLEALKKVPLEVKTETAPDWQTIIESLPENEELANFIQKTAANPKLSIQEKEAACREAWKRFLEQQEIAADALAAAEFLSLETLGLAAGQLKQPPSQRSALIETLETISEPLTETQVAEIQKDLVSRVVAYAPLAKSLGWQALVETVARETHKEFPAISLEQIKRVAFELQLASVAEKAWPAKLTGENDSVLLPPVLIVNQKLVPMVGSPEDKGNPWKINQCPEPLFYYWTTRGVSGLEELAKIQRLVSGDPNSPTSQSLAKLADGLGEFQTSYPALEASLWQIMHVREVYDVFQVTGLTQRAALAVKGWWGKSSLGQAVKLWGQRAAQKGAEGLWASVSQTGLKATATGAARSFLIKIGFQAIANFFAPIVGIVIAWAAEKVIKAGFSLIKRAGNFILSGFGLGDAVLGGITGRWEPKEDSAFGKLVMIGVFSPIILLAFLAFFTIGNVRDSALLGLGKGSPLGPGGHPEGEPPQCQPTRHLAEEVICSLTTGKFPCDQKLVNQSTWSTVNLCFDKIDLSNGQEEAVREIFANSVSNYQSLQCVGFVYAIQYALGLGLEKDLPHGAACDYAHGTPPLNYRFIEWNETIEKGDLAVWDGAVCGVNNGFFYGHIAVVIDVQEAQIWIAEAIGDDFGVHGDLLIHKVANDGKLGNPSRFLRHSP